MDIETLFGVKGKSVLVTGGSRGIGLMIAAGFVQNGARVYISSRKASVCEAVAAGLNKRGWAGVAISLPADLASYAECQRIAAEIAKREPNGLNVLVNNAGANWGAPIEEYPDQAFDKVMELNTKRIFTLTQQLLPSLEKAGNSADPARVINIGSVDGIRVPELSTYAYSASKAATHHLSRVLAANLANRHITVNSVAPGPFESKMMAETLKSFGEVIVAGIPLGRIGQPEDMAGVCIYLASKAGAYVTGALIAVDGGALVRPKM
ncbi:rhamnolipids biosynthesis 3-oxoacyl-reductase [Ramicandelaber brevisporus]|nr:rhamnolipids biosynthesis 3-oxoacyl-reductase [Ramicandelaber brevisporus]